MVGRTDEVRGFALAGVDPIVCVDEASAAGVLERLEVERGLGLIMITPSVASMAPVQVMHLQHRIAPPVLIVLHDAPPLAPDLTR